MPTIQIFREYEAKGEGEVSIEIVQAPVRPDGITQDLVDRFWAEAKERNPAAQNRDRWDYVGSEVHDHVTLYAAPSKYANLIAQKRCLQEGIVGKSDILQFGNTFGFGIFIELNDTREGEVVVLGRRADDISWCPCAMYLAASGGVEPNDYLFFPQGRQPSLFYSADRELEAELGIRGVELLSIGSVRDHDNATNNTDMLVLPEPLNSSIEQLLEKYKGAREVNEHKNLWFIPTGGQELLNYIDGKLAHDVKGTGIPTDDDKLVLTHGPMLMFGRYKHGQDWRQEAEEIIRSKGHEIQYKDIKQWTPS